VDKDSTSSSLRTELASALYAAHRRGKLGHAMLFLSRSEKNLDGTTFVDQINRYLLCLSPQVSTGACLKCESCRLLQGERSTWAHPDFFLLRPEALKGFAVEDLRQFQHSFSLRHSLSNNRVCLLESAHLLSATGAQAANALLKLIEEPRPHSFSILSTDQMASVLPTIRSRCQHFRIPMKLEDASVTSDHSLLNEWLHRGGAFPQSLSMDNDSYFEEREEAFQALRLLYDSLWLGVREELGTWSRLKVFFVLEFFKAFEIYIRSLKFYASAGLGWTDLRVKFGKCPSS